MINNTDLYILDAEKTLKTSKDELQTEYTKFNIKMNLKNERNIICVIIGLDKFISSLDGEETEFKEMLDKTEDKPNVTFVIVENATKIKNHEYDDWYKEYITGEDGIWIGNGIEDQYVLGLNSNRNIVNYCGESFGYAITNGQEKMIKLLGIKEKGENNE